MPLIIAGLYSFVSSGFAVTRGALSKVFCPRFCLSRSANDVGERHTAVHVPGPSMSPHLWLLNGFLFQFDRCRPMSLIGIKVVADLDLQGL
jgi:hypothetical protein